MEPPKGRKERQMAVDSPASAREIVEVEMVDLPGVMGSTLRLPRARCGTRCGGVR